MNFSGIEQWNFMFYNLGTKREIANNLGEKYNLLAAKTVFGFTVM